jgi:hypothetical protein
MKRNSIFSCLRFYYLASIIFFKKFLLYLLAILMQYNTLYLTSIAFDDDLSRDIAWELIYFALLHILLNNGNTVNIVSYNISFTFLVYMIEGFTMLQRNTYS